MAVLSLKPYNLEYLVKSDGYEDTNGDYHSGTCSWAGNIPCDIVPSGGKANEIQFEDGKSFRYSYIVYMDKDVREFNIGEIVRISNRHMTKIFEVKGFQRYQLQSKIWV